MARKSLQLGRAVEWPDSADEAKLDRVPNPQKDTNYLVRFTAPEFTSLCPVTGQPDFAHLVIDYVPGQWLLESKSLKLYVASFRNHGAFHEDCTVMIGKRIAAEIKPKWLRIGGYWYPRGGIPIDVFWQTGKLPEGHVDSGSGRRALSRPGVMLRASLKNNLPEASADPALNDEPCRPRANVVTGVGPIVPLCPHACGCDRRSRSWLAPTDGVANCRTAGMSSVLLEIGNPVGRRM